MDKTFQLAGKTADGRPLVHLVEPGTGYGLGSSAGLDKVASGEHLPEVMELVHAIQPQPDRLYVVNSALGSGEWVGFNLRGDWFTERGLLHVPPGWHDIPVWDVDARRRAAAQTENVDNWGAMAWGYPTFYNAHRFRHHVNKDPARAYGFILGAFWDPRMHRVVLVSELVREMCVRLGALDVYERIARGEFPDTSMGAKVPYDRCSICNHVARTPKEYCEHVRQGAASPYGMRAILPDGRMCGVYNDYPRFFDDSYVFVGAERSAKVMANVTGLVVGDRSYGSDLYLPGGQRFITTREVRADSPGIPRAEQELRLARALESTATSRVRGPAEEGVAGAISRCLSAIPVADDRERKALAHAEQAERRRAAVHDGTISPEELRFWTAAARKDLRTSGVEQDHEDRALAMLRNSIDALGVQKIGSSAKWAEHVKRIPVPSAAQSALLRDHTSRLSRVLPAPLPTLAGSPADFWGLLSQLAHLGVVLRPDEFQLGSLHAMGEADRASQFSASGSIFARTPLDVLHEPTWRPAAPDGSVLDGLAQLLGPALLGRSFAPRMVAIRIVVPPEPAACSAPATELHDPLLNRISQMYNEYRTGLLTRTPDWGYVPHVPSRATPADVTKLGDAASSVSDLLLHLAYW